MFSIFNKQKYKNKWGRGLRRTSNLLFTSNNDKSLKDFAWHKAKPNPFGKEEGHDWRFRLKLICLIVCLVAMILIGLYHSFFQIKKINVTGLIRINSVEFNNSVFGAINYKEFLVLPANNYFLMSPRELLLILKNKFPIESISIKKTFPDTLNIVLEEKISTIIYDNGVNYNYLDSEGKVVEILRKVGDDEWQRTTRITTTTDSTTTIEIVDQKHIPNVKTIIAELGDYPIVYDTRSKTVELGSNILNKDIVGGVIKWFNLITKNTNIPFGYVIIDNELGTGTIKTGESWSIMVPFDNNDLEKQFKKLQYLLEKEIKRPNLSYIDLRFGDRVYWQ